MFAWFCLFVWKKEKQDLLCQWFSILLMLWIFNKVPCAVVTPNHEVTLLCHNWNLSTVMSHNANTCYLEYLIYTPQKGHDPQIENSCFKWKIIFHLCFYFFFISRLTYLPLCVPGEMLNMLRALAALAYWFWSVMQGSSQLPVTPVSGNMMPSANQHGHGIHMVSI